MKIRTPVAGKFFTAAATGASLAVAQADAKRSEGSSMLQIQSDTVASPVPKRIQPPKNSTPRFHQIVISGQAGWDDEAQKRFRELASAKALGRLTPRESKEYENLKTARRMANPSRTFDQIRADMEQHAAVNAAIAGLQQLIDHGTRVFKTEA